MDERRYTVSVVVADVQMARSLSWVAFVVSLPQVRRSLLDVLTDLDDDDLTWDES